MNEQQSSLEMLQDIKNMMNKSSRFLSLSGWSGVWAGIVALIADGIAYYWIKLQSPSYKDFIDTIDYDPGNPMYYLTGSTQKFVLLAVATLIVAVFGAVFFTQRKNAKKNQQTFNAAAKKMIVSMAIPLAAGAFLCWHFLKNGHIVYIVPATLIFYGLTLINSSKYTLTDIRYLGLCEVVLGCIALAIPKMGLFFWGFGFGILHIFYGILMWRKYDRA